MSTQKEELEDLLQTSEPSAPEGVTDEDVVEVPIEDDQDDDEPKTRKERRRERGKLYKALMESESKRSALEARLARLEGVAQAVTSQPQQQAQQQDPLDALHSEYISHRNRIKGEYDALAAAGQLTPEKQDALQRDLDQLELQGELQQLVDDADRELQHPADLARSLKAELIDRLEQKIEQEALLEPRLPHHPLDEPAGLTEPLSAASRGQRQVQVLEDREPGDER